MCDQFRYSYGCQNDFYHHYMQQHAAMRQMIERLHRGIVTPSFHNAYPTCQCNCHRSSPRNEDYVPGENNLLSESSSTSSEDETSSTSTDSETNESDSGGVFEDVGNSYDDSSDCEYELNVDAIMAMRAAKEELSKSSSSESSFAIVGDSEKEDCEYIELGSLKMLDYKRLINLHGLNKHKELQIDKKIMEYIYGEKSSTIAGLETAMSVNFERLCDVHQAPLWPVLPVRL